MLRKISSGLMALADIHPAMVHWFDDRIGERPELASTLVFGIVIMVWNLERPMLDPASAYERYLESLSVASGDAASVDSVPRLDVAEFDALMASLTTDPNIKAVLGREPLIVEHGVLGRIRRELWAKGLREPHVSLAITQLEHHASAIH